MMRVAVLVALFTVASASASVAVAATDPKYSWNLAELYPTEAAWAKAKDAAVADFPKIEGCRGKLTSSAATLLGCLDSYFDIDRRLQNRSVSSRKPR
jgi:oligoendopeptidase F